MSDHPPKCSVIVLSRLSQGPTNEGGLGSYPQLFYMYIDALGSTVHYYLWLVDVIL